ncbi:MAG: STAS-like domain-containing protein [Gemmatimonadales bacterium]
MKDHIRILLGERDTIAPRDIVAATGLTRQAVHYHLLQMLEKGEITRVGAGRGTRYRRSVDFAARYALGDLEEDVVWREVLDHAARLREARENVRSILTYAFTEMLNNAIEHSSGSEAHVLVWAVEDTFAFEVSDDGVGAFRHVREKLELRDDFEAIEQLSKGKLTTLPERHTGEGIFFTSRMVDRFEIHAGGLRWVVDNLRNDEAVGEVPRRRGTRVRCELSRHATRTTAEIFERFADPERLEFGRSSVPVRLFKTGGTFVSRSEARRLASRLEKFGEVTIDFSGVREVGRGFVDELFRVWARQHPDTRLVPANMVPAVERMVMGALARSGGADVTTRRG